MFSGIIQDVGTIIKKVPHQEDMTLLIKSELISQSETKLGDSIAVNGVCLTVTRVYDDAFQADVSKETLSCTSIGHKQVGDRVNLEKSLRFGSGVDGHLVMGHVDSLGKVLSRNNAGRSTEFWFESPSNLAKYIARKGSICIDGVSLTVNKVDGARFSVNIVPHTLEKTIMGDYQPDHKVNLEIDMMARYLERLVEYRGDNSPLTYETLLNSGFVKN